MGLLTGRRPRNLGINEGRLAKVATHKWNAVSSYEKSPYHKVDAIKVEGDAQAFFKRLHEMIARIRDTEIIEANDHYLRAEFTTKLMRFVDDAEFLLKPEEGVVHVRSASRLGRKDFGVNRARIELIRSGMKV